MSADAQAGQSLPIRTSRRRPAGRHRSPDRLSVPPDAPALVLAIPGACGGDGIGAAIAASAAASCPGIAVRVGYLQGRQDHLGAVLAATGRGRGPGPGATAVSAVVVPMVTGPVPDVQNSLAKAVAQAGVSTIVTDYLGPHPLLAEALHARLADAGLARAGRIRQISIVTSAEGVIMGVAGGSAAVQEAGVVAVLLAARLAVPVVPAALGDAASLADAVSRLADARATKLALAPCVIGPETTEADLTAATAMTSAPMAPLLGDHPAVGRLVAMRYGTALQDPRLAPS